MTDTVTTPANEGVLDATPATRGAVEIPVGTEVIAWNSSGVYTYGGLAEHLGMEQTAFTFREPNPIHYTDPTRVAPASTPIPDADPRVRNSISKWEGPKEYWMAGRWVLTLPIEGAGRTFHRTKKDADEAGRRRMAIADYHAAAE